MDFFKRSTAKLTEGLNDILIPFDEDEISEIGAIDLSKEFGPYKIYFETFNLETFGPYHVLSDLSTETEEYTSSLRKLTIDEIPVLIYEGNESAVLFVRQHHATEMSEILNSIL